MISVLMSVYKNEKVEYNGQLISKYDASQIQRKMERNIRQNKKDIAGLQGILASNNSDIDIEQTRKNLKIFWKIFFL